MKKAGEAKKHIHLCNIYEEHLLHELESLNVRRKLNIVTKKQYKKQLTALLRGRPVEEWMDYYRKYKGACFNVIREEESDRNFRLLLFMLLMLVLFIPFGMQYTGFSVYDPNSISVNKVVSANAYLLIDGVAQSIPLDPEFYNGDYVYRIKYLQIPAGAQKIEIIDNNNIVFSKEIK